MSGAEGLQFAIGIPGTTGGAVAMNAGAYDCTISSLVEKVTVRLASGEKKELESGECRFGYRTSRFLGGDTVVESVDLLLGKGDPDVLKRDAAGILALRRRNYPLDRPNAGSVFRRPDQGPPPGLLIEKAGMKGFACGGASVSRLHANFIVNDGNATSDDVARLIDTVRDRVSEKSGILLEEEIRYIPSGGEWN